MGVGFTEAFHFNNLRPSPPIEIRGKYLKKSKSMTLSDSISLRGIGASQNCQSFRDCSGFLGPKWAVLCQLGNIGQGHRVLERQEILS